MSQLFSRLSSNSSSREEVYIPRLQLLQPFDRSSVVLSIAYLDAHDESRFQSTYPALRRNRKSLVTGAALVSMAYVASVQ